MRISTRRYFTRWPRLAVAILALPYGMHPARASGNDAVATASEAITSDAARQYVSALADDTFEGRAAGSRGGRAAGLYIVKELQAHGLKGAAAKGFYQPFDGGLSNILAIVEGSDPELKNQIILIGAHYDHVGYGNSRNSYGPIGHIHNGADDNASGVAGLLEVVAAFAKLPQPPKRSVLFAFWDGEELGLVGSKYWVEHPTLPLNRVTTMINIDMIGRLRGNRLDVYGSRTSRGFRRLVSEQNAGLNLTLNFDPELKANSDHYPFYSKHVPYLFLHTGLHNDYHRPSDDVDKINVDGVRQSSLLLFKLTYELAQRSHLNGYRPSSRTESTWTVQSLEQPMSALPGRLGVTWDERANGPGLLVTRVNAGSPAAKAGVRSGDRITRAAGREIASAEDFRAIVLSTISPLALTVQRRGSEKPLELTVALSGHPIRLGITWRDDEAEPDSVIVARVVPGSPADRAGLRVGERLYQVNGASIAGSADCGRRLAEITGPMEFEVENRGRIRTVKVEPLTVSPGIGTPDATPIPEPQGVGRDS
jgi:hypothetical protein